MTRSLLITFLLGVSVLFLISPARSDLPDCWSIVSDTFDQGIDPDWRFVPPDNPDLQPSFDPQGGFQSSGGLAVPLTQAESYMYRSRVADAEEAYISFLFNPASCSIPDEGTTWIPGKSIRIADIKGGEAWHTMVALRIRKPAGSGYTGYLEWHAPDGTRYDYESGEFAIADDWQWITLGYRTDRFIEVLIDGVSVRRIEPVDHEQETGSIIEFGKCSTNSSMTPSGTVRFDNVAFLIPRIRDLHVDPDRGDDANEGTSPEHPLRTIQRGMEKAGPGTRVHLAEGVYRESIRPVLSGTASEPIRIVPEGHVAVRGSVPSSVLSWQRLMDDPIGLPAEVDPGNLYWAEIPGLEAPPRWIAVLDEAGVLQARMPVAREPDWQVVTDWKRHEYWWCADGGSAPAECDPGQSPDCDLPWRSLDQLTDRTDDLEPAGIEPGNLMSLGDLTGGTIVAIDTKQGHYVYRRTIVSHDPALGRVTVDAICEHDNGSGDPGLGLFSKYYVENRPCLLDSPGEWWFDALAHRLYIWPPLPIDPALQNIEISVLDDGFNLRDASFIHIEDLVIEFFNDCCIEHENWTDTRSWGNRIERCELRYANTGINVVQSIAASESPDHQTRDLLIRGNSMHHLDTQAIRHVDWWENGAAADSWVRPGIVGTRILDNDMYELGFRCDGDNAVGLSFGWSDRLTFEGNHVHHVAHNGVQFSRSVIQSDSSYGFTPDEIKTGDILVLNNIFEKACQLTCDNGGIKFWGKPPDGHVFRNVLVTGNVARDNFGWTFCAEKRGRWTAGQARGTGGFGFYVDMASGVTFFRNIAYNNGYCGFMFSGVWRDGNVSLMNNLAANQPFGFIFGGSSFDTHGCVQTAVVNNMTVNNDGYGMLLADADDDYANMYFDYNLYQGNGWHEDVYRGGCMGMYVDAGDNHYYPGISDIRSGRNWEMHGIQVDPVFLQYDWADHDKYDASWPDFRIDRLVSPALDAGSSDALPIISDLAGRFGLDLQKEGLSFDIGRFESYPYPELPTGVTIWMPGEMFRPGDDCACLAGVFNGSNRILSHHPVCILLDIYGQYYFAPDFGFEYADYLEELPAIPYGLTILTVLPAFSWPEHVGSGSGVTWYGAILDPGMTSVMGDLGVWSFGWSSD